MRMVAVTGAVVAMVALAACGSEDVDSASSASSKSVLSAEALSEVQATVQRHLKRPTSVGIDEPVKSVPKGKTIYYVHSQTPTAVATADSAEAAARALGWTFKRQAVKPSPEGFQQGFENALRDSATSAIISTSVPISAISKHVQRANSRDIPVVVNSPDTETGRGNLYGVGGPKNYDYAGRLEADYILADTKGDAQVLLVLPEAFPTIDILADGFKDEWKTRCPDCKAPLEFRAPLTSFGKDFPSLLTAYLQAHRDVDYLVFGFSDMMIGVPQALKGAGLLTGLKAIAWAQGPQTNQMLGEGLLQAQVGVPLVEIPWVAMDILLRVFNGQSTEPDQGFLGPGSPMHWIITKESMTAAGLDPTETWPLNPNYQDQLKNLWGLTS